MKRRLIILIMIALLLAGLVVWFIPTYQTSTRIRQDMVATGRAALDQSEAGIYATMTARP